MPYNRTTVVALDKGVATDHIIIHTVPGLHYFHLACTVPSVDDFFYLL